MNEKVNFEWISAFHSLAEKFIEMHNEGKEAELADILYDLVNKNGYTDKTKKIFSDFITDCKICPFTALIYVITQYRDAEKVQIFYSNLHKKLGIAIDNMPYIDAPGIPLIQHGWTDFTKATAFDNWDIFTGVFNCKEENALSIIDMLSKSNDGFNASKSTALFIINSNFAVKNCESILKIQ